MKFLKMAFFLVLMLSLQSAMALTYGRFTKYHGLRADAGELHTTFFRSRSKDPVPTHVTFKFGKWANNTCQPLFSDSEDVNIADSYTFGICADCIQELGGYIDCVTEEYTNTGTGKFTGFSYQLIWDTQNKIFTHAIPSSHTVDLD